MSSDWSTLPSHIVVAFMKNLTVSEASRAGRTCKNWLAHFNCAQLWREVDLNFYRGFEADKLKLKAIEVYGPFFRSVIIRLDQHDMENRLLATEAIKNIANIPSREVQNLRIEFTGENPLFYGGQEFLESLEGFARQNENVSRTLTRLDFSTLPINLVDSVLYSFDFHLETLQYLDLQNRQLICQVTPECIDFLVNRCPNMRDWRLFHSSLSDQVLLSLSQKAALKHLSILCRRQEKFKAEDLSDHAWSILTAANRDFYVSLKFDYTCPLWKVRQIMKESVPVRDLFLETYTLAHAELDIASDVYSASLRKLVLQTQPSDELDTAVLQAAERCPKLQSLHVMCPLEKETIEGVMLLLPQLSVNKQYTLTTKAELFFPWAYDKVLDEIKTNTGWPRH